MHGPTTAGAGRLRPARVGEPARNPGAGQPPEPAGYRTDRKQDRMGAEVALGIVIGIAATKAAQKVKERVKSRLRKEVESAVKASQNTA